MLLRSRDHKRMASNRQSEVKEAVTAVVAPTSPAVAAAPLLQPALPTPTGNQKKEREEDIDSDIHTVPSDLEVLLSESEFLFSDA
jgi:disintegrin and metalloproteinase domain-containing protein 10